MAQKGHTILVTNVEGDGPRLKVWGVVDKQNLSYIEKIIGVLSKNFNHQGGPDAQTLVVNTVCCAKYRGSYVRAKVCAVQANGVVVQLIDSGIVDVLPVEVLRLLYANSNEGTLLLTVPPLAKEFTLANIVSVNEKWESRSIETLMSFIKDKELEVSHYDFYNNRYFVKLVYGVQDIGTLLINKKMAVMTTLDEMFKSQMYSQQPPYKARLGPHQQEVPAKENTTNGYADAQNIYNSPHAAQISIQPNVAVDNWRFNQQVAYAYQQNLPQQNLPQQNFPQHNAMHRNVPPQNLEVEEEPSILEFRGRLLEVGQVYRVFVSYVEDGPIKFSVQIESMKGILKTLMSDIQKHEPLPLREPPLPGSVCLARLKSNKCICRAVVMATMETQIKIYYVDFGHTEVVPYSDIYQLPPKFINPKVLSIRICLSGLKEMNITEEAKKYFKDLIQGKEVELHVCEPEGPFLIQYGNVFYNSKNVKEYLKDRFPDIAKVEYGHLPSLTDGTKEIVHVSYVASCSRFFVQLEKNIKDIEDMMTQICEYATDAPPMNNLSVGSIGIAPYDVDNQWYRVKILKIQGDKISVLYVDYGNEESVSRNQLRDIRKDFVSKMPSQAILCVLNGFQNRASNKELDTEFENLVFEKRLSMLVKNAQPTCLIVDLFDIMTTPPKSIYAQLIKMSVESSGSNIHNDSNTSRKSNESFKSQGQNHQRSDGKEQPTMTQSKSQKIKSKGAKTRDELEVSTISAGPGSNPFRMANNDDRSNSKSWKDDHNEQRHDNRFQRRDTDRYARDGGNNQFNRDGGNKSFNREGGNNQFNRDAGFNRDGGNDRFNRNAGNDRYNRDGSDGFNRDGGNNRFGREGNDRNNSRDGGRFNNRDDRNGGGKFGSNRREQSFNPDKYAASDNESTTSSKGSGKRVERGGFQAKRDNNNRPNFNKFGNNDNDGFKSRRHDDSGNNFRSRSARDDEFPKPREMINFDSQPDFSEPKKFTLTQPIVSIGGTNKCELVYLTNPSNFFIHQIPQNTKLDELMEGIAATYETGGTILQSSQVKPDLVCIAQFAEDMAWYRAIIKSVENTNAVVLFADYGNVEKVSFEQLKEIKEEFTHLPIQAVPCKLFGAKKTNWSAEEIDSFGDATNGKYVQAEFVTKDKDVYEILLREMENEVVKPDIINESFCPGVNLLQEKEALKNRGKVSSGGVQKSQPDYAPIDSKWSEEKINPGKKEAVLVTWFDDPESFYCQSIAKQREFRPMMEEIQKVYVKRQPVSTPLQPGYPVIAVFPEDRALYRAEIVEVNANRNYIVQYVDFGNRATLDQRNMFPVEKKYMTLPKQAIRCSLKNVIPANGKSWSNMNYNEVYKFFDADEFECTYHEEKDEKYLVSLSNNGTDVAGSLVAKKLAQFSVAGSASSVHETMTAAFVDNFSTPRFDIKLLPAQTLRAKVSNVENASKFYVQFSSAEDCNQAISSYMINNDPEVMPRLSSHEVCLGAGCLIFTDGVWRRAVVVNYSETTSFDVRLIDTGAYDKVSLDCMLALPSQLAMMQNQAIECSLYNVQHSASLNEKFKNLVENTDVIIYVEEVDNNRLIVQLYDRIGSKIQLTDDDTEAKLSPICPMPILSSTHKVTVSSADHSNSLWLQMPSDAEKDDKLIREMAEFYSVDRENIEPQHDTICAVKNLDGSFSRAMIIKKTDIGAYVNLIDYGISDDVSVDRLKVLDPQFYVPHQLAIHVSLNVTLTGSPAEQVKALKPHLLNKVFTGTFYNVHKKLVVELVENEVKLSEILTSLNLVKEATDTESQEIQGMTVGGKYKAAVTHCDSPAQFWLQRSEEISNVLDLQEELQMTVSNYPAVDKVLEVGTLCAAIFDGFWYRAEVIDADEEITTVRFIDYGNPDVITNKTNKIKELPDSMKMKKAYAVKCRLDVIPVNSEDWSEETCSRFFNLVINTENLEAALIAESIPSRVDLFIDGKSVSDILVEEKLATKVHHGEELVEEIIENELDPRSAFISHINSPNEFFVQEEKSVPDLEKIQDRFLVADMLPKVDITEGLLCVAKYTDNNWYRARVISQSEAGTELLFIDYGNTAVSTEIRAIPDDVASIPPLSRKCALQLPSYVSHWPENALENFCELAADGATIFLMDVLKEGETTIVKLTLENEDIAEKLAPPQIIFISHINSPSDFWVQEEQTVSEIDKIQEKLVEADNYATVQAEEGLICAAKFPDDGQWYRAKVLSKDENVTLVLFIDYGNSSVSTEIRALPEDLVSLAPFAKRCSLQLPSHAEEWSQDAFDMFFNFAWDGNVTFFLDVIEENETLFVNLFCGKENIAEKLAPGVAKKQLQEVAVHEEESIASEKEVAITCTRHEKKTTIQKEYSVSSEVPTQEADLIPVYISQLSSLSEFWIQEEKNFDEIQKMEDTLLEAAGFPELTEVKEGTLCAANFPIDSLWYRAKVLCQNENGTTVSFIDYGNSSVVTEMRTLPEHIAVIPSLAKKCSLKLPLNFKEWPEDTLRQFQELSADGTTCFAMDVLEDGETAFVSLYLDGESVADKFATCVSQPVSTEEGNIAEKETDVSEKESIASENIFTNQEHIKACLEKVIAILEKETKADEETAVPENVSVDIAFGESAEEVTIPKLIATSTIPVEKADSISVYISQLSSPSEFWVQEEKTFDDIQKMEDSLLEAAGFPELTDVKEGTLCAANFPIDSLWYRAKVLCQNENGTTVSFIDYGNSFVVTEMRTLPEDIAAVPSLAKKCNLKLPQNFKEWPEEAFSQFLEISADGTTCFAMDVLEDGETALVSLYLGGKSVADTLVTGASQAISAEEGTIPEEETVIPEKETVVPKMETVVPEKEPVVLEKETVVPEKETVVPEKETVVLEKENVVPEKETVVLEKEPVVPEKETVVPEKKSTLPENRTEAPEEIIALTERETAIPDKSTIPEEISLGIKDDKPVTENTSPKQDLASVYISQLNSLKEFWVQEEESTFKLNEMQEMLLNIEEFPRLQEVTEGLFCVAQFPADSLWYRAKVVSHNEEETVVAFIDYGNQSSVTELRLLPEELKAIPSLAKKCSLKLPVDIPEWPQEACIEFIKLSADGTTRFLMDVLKDGEPAIVDLKLEGESVSDKLVSSTPQKLAEKNVAVIEPEKKKSDGEAVANSKVNDEGGKVDTSSFLIWNVISPSEFWGQVGNDPMNVRAKLLLAEDWPLLDNVEEGILCAVEVNGEWKRARVQSIKNENIQVLLIDQGYTPICTEFRKLPSDLASVPPLSRKYSLKLPESADEWSQAATAAFSKYSETSFTMEVLEEAEVPVIKLLHHGEDVSQILASMHDNFSKEIIGRLPPEGEENWNMAISHVNSPSEFWGQSEFVIHELHAMVEHLKNAASLTPVKNFDVGRICAAKFSDDGEWYRGKILSHSVAGTEVYYVDFGYTTATKELRVLPHNVVNIQYLATKYSLRKPADIDEWSKEACKKFEELIDDGRTMFQYKILDLENKEVQLIYKGTDVVELLTPLCKKAIEESNSGGEISKEQRFIPKEVEVIDLTIESDTDAPTKDIPEKETQVLVSPDSAFHSGVENVPDKIPDSSQLSHEVEPVASSSMEKEDYDVPSNVQPTNEKKNELTVDDIMEKMIYEPEENITSHCSKNLVPKILTVDKIVPASVSRGLSKEEIIHDSIERRRSIPRGNLIVSGSICRGEDLPDSDSESSNKSELIVKSYPFAETSQPTSAKISYDDRIVTGSVTHGEPPVVEVTTPKTPYSEKIVAGVVNPQE